MAIPARLVQRKIPIDRTEYLAWVKQEEETLVAEFLAKNANLEQKIQGDLVIRIPDVITDWPSQEE